MSANKDASDLQERSVAKFLEGSIVSGSGCGKFGGGDVYVGDWFIECKTVTQDKKSFSIKLEWLNKMKEQAFEQGKRFHALAFRFGPKDKDYIVMPIEEFKELLEERG